jgi:hypothetical protein
MFCFELVSIYDNVAHMVMTTHNTKINGYSIGPINFFTDNFIASHTYFYFYGYAYPFAFSFSFSFSFSYLSVTEFIAKDM